MASPRFSKTKMSQKPHFKSCTSPPWILYLAIYGFFLDQEESGSSEHPLILAGLTLAGTNAVNRAGKLSSAGKDSTLYVLVLEVQSLNLADTELVTLSASDIGRRRGGLLGRRL